MRLQTSVEAHFDVLWRLLRRLGVPEPDMDDAVQEVIWILAKRLADVKPGSERAFLLSTACRVASTVRRTLRRRRETDDDSLETLEDRGVDPESLLEQRRARALLERALSALSIELRSVFVLYELERFTLSEIADTLVLAQGTVASRLRRARTAFTAEISAIEQELHP